MNTKFFSRLEVIHHMSTSLVSDFVEEVKGGRRSCVAAFSHNWTSIKIQLKLLLNQLYCSFPALTQWWQWVALRSTLQGRHFYINQSSVLAGVTRRLYRPGPAFARKRGPGPWSADRAETPGPRVRGGGRPGGHQPRITAASAPASLSWDSDLTDNNNISSGLWHDSAISFIARIQYFESFCVRYKSLQHSQWPWN